MKHSTSSHSSQSSSSSSSSTTNLDPTMCNSNSKSNGTQSGCFNAILRRILCSGGLQTHPSDQIREFQCSKSVVCGKDQSFTAKQNAAVAAAVVATITPPGIVARLMGLETMVESKPGSLSRSKSMNSVDYLGECNRMESFHKRVKSTVSFREMPTFLLLENENFLVLSFEKEGENQEFKSNGRKAKMGSADLKLKKAGKERSELKENKREKVYGENILIEKEKLGKRVSGMHCGDVGNDGKFQEITNIWPHLNASSENKYFASEAEKLCKIINHKEVMVSERLKRRRRSRRMKKNSFTEKMREIECKSEDSSPVSVLQFEHKACETEVDSLVFGLSPRRKLTPSVENDQHFPSSADDNVIIEEAKVKELENRKFDGSKKKEKHSNIDIWGEVCRVAEDEFAETNQIQAWMNKQGELGSVSADCELQIFDDLLNELIDQLVEYPI
ncbi:hypothetical protein TanjilG_25176 [Lupinus angustifolius]|uniref:DUF3741 domain-containing protein n=1 Tax=Lupinus angustifolius TaxID=3871 RepID=A0A1J7GMG8_LUPAN|nr:PREDICTED: uncharacterized protein LOC109329122 [Lupinus angustifolius]OIV95505.1 hypothetical protein TanjilG_25176 [Lupinus angustifolius]